MVRQGALWAWKEPGFLCPSFSLPPSPHAWFPTQWGKVDHLARLSPSAFTEREGGNDRLFYLSFLSSSQKCVTFYDEEIA